MFRRLLGSAIPAVLLGAAAAAFGVVLLVAGARWWVPAPLSGPVAESGWTHRSRAAFTPTGFFGAELDTATERSFSWSGSSAQLDFPGLIRSRAYRVTLDVRGGRPADVPPARLRVAVDGQIRSIGDVPGGSSQIAFEIPRADRVGAVVALDVSPAYEPGPPDPRALGVIVDDVTIAPVDGRFAPGAGAMLLAAAAVFAAVLALRICGLTGWIFAVASAGVSIGFVWLLLQDAAFLGEYPARLARIGGGALAVGAVIGLARARWPVVAGVPEWSVAAGLVLAASVVKVGLFWHPAAVVGDGIFQVHRAMVVHGGQYFFTSVTPKPFFEFPYPVALYMFALPFWSWFPTELDLLRLLRLVSIAADALAGVVLYGAARRQWGSRYTALFCACLWPLARAPFEALSNANLTNLFGQSVFAAALAGVAWMAAASTVTPVALIGVCALLVVAFLSHFGTVTVGLVMAGAAGGMLIAAGRGHTRRVGVWVFALLVVAAAASWLAYYSHFTEVYARTWASVAARESDDSSKIVAAPAVKLGRWWSGTGDDYGRPGVPVLLVAMVGALLLARHHFRDGASLVVLAWMLAWIALTALGILTPITVRANLAAAPAFIFLSAVALGTLASRSRTSALAAVALAAIVGWDGWRVGVACLQLAGSN